MPRIHSNIYLPLPLDTPIVLKSMAQEFVERHKHLNFREKLRPIIPMLNSAVIIFTTANVVTLILMSFLRTEQLGWHCGIVGYENVANNGCGIRLLMSNNDTFLGISLLTYPLISSGFLLALLLLKPILLRLEKLTPWISLINFLIAISYFYVFWIVIQAPDGFAKSLVITASLVFLYSLFFQSSLGLRPKQAVTVSLLTFLTCGFGAKEYYNYVKFDAADIIDRHKLESVQSGFYSSVYLLGSSKASEAYTLIVDPECEFSRHLIKKIYPTLMSTRHKVAILPVSIKSTSAGLHDITLLRSSKNRHEFLENIKYVFIDKKHPADDLPFSSEIGHLNASESNAPITRREFDNLNMLRKFGARATPVAIRYYEGKPIVLKNLELLLSFR